MDSESIEINQFDYDFIVDQIQSLTDEKIQLQVSEWAEQNRYLPSELTSKPGFWDNSYTPYMIEIMNCLSVNSTVRKVAVMKAIQIAATTAIIENDIGYTIDHDPCGIMYISADKELTKLSVDVKVDRMLQSCGLLEKIRSADEKSRKTGNTLAKKEFPGGFLLGMGARNPGKLRSMSVRKMRMDELDAFPDKLGNEGDPLKLAENRTKAFENSRSILYISTPLVMQTSKIYKEYLKGDQRKFLVPCKYCGKKQELEFNAEDKNEEAYGIHFKVDKYQTLIEDSVCYVCKFCKKKWHEYDKIHFLPLGEWKPTARPKEADYRSYHINALYSPPGMQSWKTICYDYLEAWDIKAERVKDIDAFRTFWNCALGLPWEERGEAPRFEKIIQHRRQYERNLIPNKQAKKEAGSIIHLLTGSVDVHKRNLTLEVIGYAVNGISYSIDYRIIEGDTLLLYGESSPWEKLRTALLDEIFFADDDKKYMIQTTFIDARYRTDEVYQFCGEFSSGVYPIMGRDAPIKTAKLREFSEYKSKAGTVAFNINSTLYKDRFFNWLRREWNTGEKQPLGYPNYPRDYGDDFFHMYNAEYKQEVKSRKTGKTIGYFWVQIPNKPNHNIDTRVYSMAALDLIVYSVCAEVYDYEGINYSLFWQYCKEEKPYYSE